MTNRRHATRVNVADERVGWFRVLQDVEIEEIGFGAITILADAPIPRGERMMLRHQAGELTFQVRAVERHTLIGSSATRDRIHLEVDSAARIEDAPPVVSKGLQLAALMWQTPVRLLDLSFAGCRFESPRVAALGEVGVLNVSGVGQPCAEVIRICRNGRQHGRLWQWVAGAEFLTLEAPAETSLRRQINVMTRIADGRI